MAKKHIQIGDLAADCAHSLTEEDLRKVTGGLLPANVMHKVNKVHFGDRVDTNTNNIIAVLIGL